MMPSGWSGFRQRAPRAGGVAGDRGRGLARSKGRRLPHGQQRDRAPLLRPRVPRPLARPGGTRGEELEASRESGAQAGRRGPRCSPPLARRAARGEGALPPRGLADAAPTALHDSPAHVRAGQA
eukprot:3935819-Rhodomonas_salina.1